MNQINETHELGLRSWVDSANTDETDFPIQNLPFAIFRVKGRSEEFRGGVAIGDNVLDLSAAKKTGYFSGDALEAINACGEASLNSFMALGPIYWSVLRLGLSRLLRETASPEEQEAMGRCLVAQKDVEFSLPCTIGDYTDFYTSIHHATTVGSLFRPDNPLLPNYKWIPIGYHGRSSSIVISGTDFPRPKGQLKPATADKPMLEPCRRLDYELELAVYVGVGNKLNDPILIDDAESHIFGIGLLNDWSARDIQAWEYQPLGPFLSKSFMSSVSPWVVTMEALAPFRSGWSREVSDPQPLPYLDSETVRGFGAIDIELEVHVETESARSKKAQPACLARTSFSQSYWTVSQLVTHHTVNGCNLRSGDLLGSGTQSGPNEGEAGSLLELSMGGKTAIKIGDESRTFLEDGDKVIIKGCCQNNEARKIGFGEVSGTVLPTKY